MLLFLSWVLLSAAESGTVVLKADRLDHDQKDDVISAAGNVDIDWGGSRLYSDMAEYYREKGVVSAHGSVGWLRARIFFLVRAPSLRWTAKRELSKRENFHKE